MNTSRITAVLIAATLTLAATAAAQDTAFTYQGQLSKDGAPFTGTRDLTFRLYDAQSQGAQVGSEIERTVEVDGGIFSTDLDFGDVFDGGDRWVEIRVLETVGESTTAYVLPRFKVSTVPYARTAWRSMNDEVDDADADPANESATEFVLSGSALRLVESGSPWEVDLTPLADTTFGDGVSLDGAGRVVRDAVSVDEAGNVTVTTGNLDVEGTVTAGAFVGDGSSISGVNRPILEVSYDFYSPVGPASSLSDLELENGASIQLPFAFTFGGISYTHIFVSPNGWLELQTTESLLPIAPDNVCLPAANHEGPFIAAYWDNLGNLDRRTLTWWEAQGEPGGRVFRLMYHSESTISDVREMGYSVLLFEGLHRVVVRRINVSPSDGSSVFPPGSGTIGFQEHGGDAAEAWNILCNADEEPGGIASFSITSR